MLYQTLHISRHFSKECSTRLITCGDLEDYYNCDQKIIAMVTATLDQMFPNFKRNETLSSLLRVESKDMNKYATSMVETSMANDLQEFLLLAVLLRIESCTFDIQLVELVDSSIQNCQDLHSKLNNYIVECLSRKDLMPSFKGGLKDSISMAHERHYAPYKSAFKKIVDENSYLLAKYQEYFNNIFENEQIITYRIDFLCIMYENKVAINSLKRERIINIINRFNRLDSILPKQDKADTPNAKNFASGLYLNAFQILAHNHVHEVELLKNEYFLLEASKCLSSLLALMSSDNQGRLATHIAKDQFNLPIQGSGHQVGVSAGLLSQYVDHVIELLQELKSLVDVNPICLEKFANFGAENDRLFTLENFLQTAFDRSKNPPSLKLSENFLSTIKSPINQRGSKNAIQNELVKPDLIAKIANCLTSYYEVIMKALHSLHTSYEKHKSKSKDLHFFLRTAILLRNSAENYFFNQNSKQLCDKFSDYLLEDNFTKNIDVIMKHENDLRLGFLFNSAIYKNNLRYEYFNFLTKTELESSKTFKKVERIAFKENNPLYLVMSFKSMENNLYELFEKFKNASFRDIGIIQSQNFGLDRDEISILINDNDEYAFFTSDKKHYDTKAPKTLMNFARNTPKTEIFDLIAIYISAIYDAICQCYSYCRNKKIQLARKFEAACMVGSDGNMQNEIISLLDEVPQTQEQTIINLTKVYEGLKKCYSNASMTAICEAFKKEYIAEYSKVLMNSLSQGEIPQPDVAQIPIMITIPAPVQTAHSEIPAPKTKKKGASVINLEENAQHQS